MDKDSKGAPQLAYSEQGLRDYRGDYIEDYYRGY